MKLRVFLNLKHATEELNSVKMGKDLCVARTTRQAIRGGYVHVEQEIFVAAFSRNDETDYGAPPVLLMPTCDFGMLLSLWRCSVKHGKYHRLAKLSMVLSGR